MIDRRFITSASELDPLKGSAYHIGHTKSLARFTALLNAPTGYPTSAPGGYSVVGFRPTWLAWRSNALHARRAEQIPTKARMAYRAVADDIDERGLAGPQCTFECRAKLLRPLDVLTVTIHELEHPVVALVR